MSHDGLVKAAAQWLSKKHSVVVTEMSHSHPETPDAIGFSGSVSTLIECKTSRADFVADVKKSFRIRADVGMGNLRYFLAPPGVISGTELPPKWGLLELTGSKVRLMVKAQPQDCIKSSEVSLLVSAMRRLGPVPPFGCSVRFYTMPSRNRASVGIECDEFEVIPT